MRMRALNTEEEERLSTTLNSFIAAIKELREVAGQIDEYLASGADDELANFDQKTADFRQKAAEKQAKIDEMQPELDDLVKAVDDQERHKKNLKENIELIASKQRIGELEKEIAELEKQASTVEGQDTVTEDIQALRARKESFLKSTARLEGRRGEILETIRGIKVSWSLFGVSLLWSLDFTMFALQRKLSADEYKNVDEEYRVGMIKYETTQMAVKDLEKYYTALDKVCR